MRTQRRPGHGGNSRAKRLDHSTMFTRISTVLVLVSLWVIPWLSPKEGRPIPAAYYAALAVASVVLLLWMRRMRLVWFDDTSFTIRDWFSRPVEVPKSQLVKVRAVPMNKGLSWVTLTFEPPTAYGAAVRVMTGQTGQSERFLQLVDRMKAIAEKRPAKKPVAAPNDKAIAVRGWSKSELEQILGDFRELYSIPDLPMTLADADNGTITLRFPANLEPRLFLFLVNYLHYPEHVAVGQRSVSARGTCTLTPEFQLPDATLVGGCATFYVPADDAEFDFVMATLDSGVTYRIPFTDLRWRAAAAQPVR